MIRIRPTNNNGLINGPIANELVDDLFIYPIPIQFFSFIRLII